MTEVSLSANNESTFCCFPRFPSRMRTDTRQKQWEQASAQIQQAPALFYVSFLQADLFSIWRKNRRLPFQYNAWNSCGSFVQFETVRTERQTLRTGISSWAKPELRNKNGSAEHQSNLDVSWIFRLWEWIKIANLWWKSNPPAEICHFSPGIGAIIIEFLAGLACVRLVTASSFHKTTPDSRKSPKIPRTWGCAPTSVSWWPQNWKVIEKGHRLHVASLHVLRTCVYLYKYITGVCVCVFNVHIVHRHMYI